MLNVPIVSGATAWDDPVTGETLILVVNEGLYYGKKLDHSLLNPNQIRAYQVGFWDNPYDPYHSLSIDVDRATVIPLDRRGTKVYFTSRAPTEYELANCHHVELTSNAPWEPHDVTLGQVESCSHQPLFHNDHDDTADATNLRDAIVSQIRVRSSRQISTLQVDDSMSDVPSRRTFVSAKRHTKLTADSLSELWGIGLLRAHDTLKATTQRGVRSAILPIGRRYRADRMYQVKRLGSKFSTDTLYADIKSLRQNTCAQIFTHKCGVRIAYPMRAATGDSIGHSLLNFAHDYGAPDELIFDGAQAQVGPNTLFMKTLRKLLIKYHVSSLRQPNENPSEGGIYELKKRWYRIMVKKKVPRRLWDFRLVWVFETGNFTVSSS